MATAQPHLLIGTSVRYLSQSAYRAGMQVAALDRFVDDDTRVAASHSRQLPAMSQQALMQALAELGEAGDVPWTYAAGFEADPEALASLVRQQRNLLGNTPDVLRLLADPERYVSLLDTLEIAYPKTVFGRPAETDGWLYKAAGRQGGYQVWPADTAEPQAPGYYQRCLSGELCSLLFAANGKAIQPLGFNRLSACAPQRGDFRFACAISGYLPDERLAEQMTLVAQRLTRALGLRGINGVDFVLHEGDACLLELNARPPASLELYELRLPRGGLQAHIAACQGELPPAPTSDAGNSGLQIVYAPHGFRIGRLHWPEWVSDRPRAGSTIASGAPLVSVRAVADSIQAVAERLRQRAQAVIELLEKPAEAVA
jgi:uncharacterized protein